MAEIGDRIPGEIIFASYANQIRDRAVMRYVDAVARQASEPLPSIGTLSYLTVTGIFSIWDGSTWVDFATDLKVDTDVAALSARLDVLEAQDFSNFEDVIKAIPVGSYTTLGTATVPVDGDYLITVSGYFSGNFQASTTSRVDLKLHQEGSVISDFEQWDLFVGNNQGTNAVDLPWSMTFPRLGMLAADTVEWSAQAFNSTVDMDVRLYWVALQKIRTGVMTDT